MISPYSVEVYGDVIGMLLFTNLHFISYLYLDETMVAFMDLAVLC